MSYDTSTKVVVKGHGKGTITAVAKDMLYGVTTKKFVVELAKGGKVTVAREQLKKGK